MSTPPPEPTGDGDWIEKVVNAAGALGFNKMRLRWKLIRWQERRRQAARRREQRVQHITYAHKTCGECGAVEDKDATVCGSCGAKLGKRAFQVLRRLGVMLPVGLSVSSFLALAILVTYGKTWIEMGGGFGTPSAALLHDLGARWPPSIKDEPWRLLTPVFLHIGLWHLAFNLLAIASIGPRIEERYGRFSMLGLCVATGVLANMGALAIGDMVVSAGASGGIMGLIGVAAGSGHREGTARGRELRNDMLKWSAYTFVFGFGLGADNWAHLFGGLAGALFGFAVTPMTWKRRALIPMRVLVGLIGIGGTIAAIALILTREPSPTVDPQVASDDGQDEYIEMCKRHRAGDMPGAIAALTAYMQGFEEDGAMKIDACAVEQACGSLEILRQGCNAGTLPVEQCRMYRRVFRELPPLPMNQSQPR
ncbi:MAG: rhomboid family intramembrane serine protease [Kofleriaceae bacterium]|nr:rhomboid family intramembrane serine protease [Kofleriaceae bacterium]